MKNLPLHLFLFLLLVFLLSSTACNTSINKAIKSNQTKLTDGLYLVTRTGTTAKEILPLKPNEKIITFNKEFIDKTDQEKIYLVVNAQEYAPLLLKEKPKTETQKDDRKKLLLHFTDDAKLQLEQFTTKHLNKTTGIVVNGEALTKHKIKSVIDGGFLQVTRCTDNACEMLFFELEDNVVK